MTAAPGQTRPAGHALFAQYAFPPNELGYCGPEDKETLWRTGEQMSSVAREFDGAWPYLQAIADAYGTNDPLDHDVVRSYWVGDPRLAAVDPGQLLNRLRSAFTGQVTGLLDHDLEPAHTLAHHSFHVFVVYPWMRFLDRDPTTPLRIFQNCRIRWGTVQSVDDEHVELLSRPLTLEEDRLMLGDPAPERVRWSRDGTALTAPPAVGDTVTAHWDWVCGKLGQPECGALAGATQHTLDAVNAARGSGHH